MFDLKLKVGYSDLCFVDVLFFIHEEGGAGQGDLCPTGHLL